MTRACGCSEGAVVVDAERHAAWHRAVAPLQRADAIELQAAFGRPSTAVRTFVDDQFDAARGGVR